MKRAGFTSLRGLIAATYTPLDPVGHVACDVIPSMVEHLLAQGVNGLYVCGSTGEGMSLTNDERQATAQAYVQAAAGRVPVIIQVGHNSVRDAQQLATHAQQIGADAISATCPSYFKADDIPTLVTTMAEVAAGAPDLPFYYYHIPVLTGSGIDIVEFLKCGRERIGNLVGLKYTDTKLHEFQQCLELHAGELDVVWGCDEMLLGALATGAKAAIGSTYNLAAPLYHRLIDAFDQGDLAQARKLQSQSIALIRTLGQFPFHPAAKAVLEMLGIPCGACRLPQRHLSDAEIRKLRSDLEAIGYLAKPPTEGVEESW